MNDPLVDAPETINEDPYEEGWMIVMEAVRPEGARRAAGRRRLRAYFVEEAEE